MAILNPPSTITTTLTPTSSERTGDGLVSVLEARGTRKLKPFFAADRTASVAIVTRPDFSGLVAAAAAWAARRAAAMKLDLLAVSGDAAAAPEPVISAPATRSAADAAARG